MPPELLALAALPLAGACTWALVGPAIALAHRTGFLDRPAGYKAHRAPTPYLGGVALVLGLAVAALATGALARGPMGALLLAAGVLWLVGTLDDRRGVGPGTRVLVEVAVALGLWWAGHGWSVLGGGAADAALTVLWVLGVVNACNLMDNMDGAACTVAGTAAAGAGVLALAAGDPVLATGGLAVAGACAGFLPANLGGPARIFLGDGGSMPLGLLVAGTTMASAQTLTGHPAAVLVAVLLCGLLVLDTSLVCVSRRRAGRPLLQGGRDHLTHRLAARLGDPRAVAGWLAPLQAALCALAVSAGLLGPSVVIAVTAAAVAGAAWAIARLEGPAWAAGARTGRPGAAASQPSAP